ncbi:MAG: DUF255 domain-containing protein [Ruminococcus sp.]|nr:DUF255 domain-containing protein [Ruminococcus sp.]
MNNQLKKTSPYLLQHAETPVNWYIWSDEAFEAAKMERCLHRFLILPQTAILRQYRTKLVQKMRSHIA